MADYSFVAIIFNPNSTGDSKSEAKVLRDSLKRHSKSLRVELIPTKYAGHAEELAHEIALRRKNPLIVSSSGDGGYHEVVNGAMRAQNEGATPICAVLPAGNANDHRNAVAELPLEKSIKKGDVRSIDLLKVEIGSGKKGIVRYGHSYLGLGLTPTVAIELNRHTLSALKEMSIVIRSFYQFQPFEIEVDKKPLRLDSLIISNIGRMAKVLSFEATDLDDGIFEVTIIPHGNKFALLSQLLRAATKGLPSTHNTGDYSFKALKDMPMQIDGEIMRLKQGTAVKVTSSKKMLRTLL